MTRIFLLFFIILLAACTQPPPTIPPLEPTKVPDNMARATALPADPAQPTEPPPTASTALAAEVNGQPILMARFQRELAREEQSRQDMGIAIPPDRAAFEREVLDKLIETMLIEQAAAEASIAVTEEELDAEVARQIEDAGGGESWNAWLTMSHLTPEEFREQLRAQMLGNKMTTRITSSLPAEAEQVHARHILVELESTAQEVLNQLQAGGDFAALAQQYSIDGSTRETGGDLSWFARGQLLESEIEAIAFSLQPGETSGVVPSRLGYHIVQTLERDPARPIAEDVRADMIHLAIQRWVEGLWQEADITRY